MFRTIASSLLTLAICGSAIAQDPATTGTPSVLVEIEGSVMVNTGTKFEAVPNGTKLRMGDTIMAADDSSALVKYEDGCDMRVEPGTMVTLSDRSPCAGWIPFVQAAPGSVALGAGATTGIMTWQTGLGILAIVGIPILIHELNDGDPKSP